MPTQYVTPWGRKNLQFSASDGEPSLEFRKSKYWSSSKSLKTIPPLILMAGHCLSVNTLACSVAVYFGVSTIFRIFKFNEFIYVGYT